MAAAKCKICGAGPMNYKTYQKHYYKNHYTPKGGKKKKKKKFWGIPKRKR